MVVVFALLTVFAIELSDNQSASKHNLEVQAHQRAVLVSGLMDAVFGQSAHVGPHALRRYSAAHVSEQALNRSQGTNAYVVLLSDAGTVLAHSRGFSARDSRYLTTSKAASAVSAAQPWWIGDVTPRRHREHLEPAQHRRTERGSSSPDCTQPR